MWFHPEGNPAVRVSVARAGGRERPRAWGSPPPTLAHFCTGSLRAIASTPRRSCVVSRLSRCCVEAGGASADALRVPRRSGPGTGREDDGHHRGCQDGHGLAATPGTGQPRPRRLARARYRHQDRGDAGGSRTGQKPADHRPPLVPGGCRRRHRRMGCRNADQR